MEAKVEIATSVWLCVLFQTNEHDKFAADKSCLYCILHIVPTFTWQWVNSILTLRNLRARMEMEAKGKALIRQRGKYKYKSWMDSTIGSKTNQRSTVDQQWINMDQRHTNGCVSSLQSVLMWKTGSECGRLVIGRSRWGDNFMWGQSCLYFWNDDPYMCAVSHVTSCRTNGSTEGFPLS